MCLNNSTASQVVKWSPEDCCYVGNLAGPLGPCCHGDDPEAVRQELAEIEHEWRALLGMPRKLREVQQDV